MKFATSTYSFTSLTGNDKLTQFECIGKVKEIGFDGIEFINIDPKDGTSPIEYAKKLAEECKKQSLEIVSYTIAADFLNCSNGDVSSEIERLKAQVDIAYALGVKCMRHDATQGFNDGSRRGFNQALPILADACREVTRYAASKGIKTTVENHGYFCQDSNRVESLITAVADENFGWLCDIGNFLCVDEQPEKAVGVAAGYAFHVHVKDFVVKSGNEPNPGKGFFKTRAGNYLKGTVVGHGNVPVLQCLSILKNSGYNGYVSIEFEGMENPIEALTISLENLKYYHSLI